MSLAGIAVAELKSTEQFFNRSTRTLSEEHSGARPAPGMMTAAQQVAHAAQTIDLFIEGAFVVTRKWKSLCDRSRCLTPAVRGEYCAPSSPNTARKCP